MTSLGALDAQEIENVFGAAKGYFDFVVELLFRKHVESEYEASGKYESSIPRY
jgi:hypothetical protein